MPNGVVYYNSDPVNGRYSQGTSVVYFCNVGYLPAGAIRLSCSDGEWIGTDLFGRRDSGFQCIGM